MIGNTIIRNDIENIVNSNLPWEKFTNKHILITGANGFLPSYLVYSLLEANEKFSLNLFVTALVRNLEKATNKFVDYKNNINFRILHKDINDQIEYEGYNFIIHAASQASPKFYSIDPIGTFKPNVIGTNNLLSMLQNYSIDSFLYFSSSEVYGQVPELDNPITENNFGIVDPSKVRSCYAESKRMGENICVSYFHQNNIPVKIVRPFHTYGPGMALDDGRVYADLVKNILNNESIMLTSDGLAKRAFCYISDATIGFLTVLLNGKPGEAYNIGNESQEYSIKELAELLTKMYPEKGLTVTTKSMMNKDYIPSNINRNCPNCNKAEAIGWKASTTVEEGFQRTINSYK